ncbi:ABC transporter ATP-binding protein [Desertivirga arenae]|uniref:ABC transporter ATP-binding protein n=1 Tax=Desertivirga arenae TaxID=2810309 RepID=UPI001A96700D|nr:ATP-binding cassette domain-containing protein [Pedobacter sp. SYSU D00823]
MRIELNHIGRRFNREWIFRNLDYVFEQGISYAILGANGSGKSTLLQVVAGNLSPSEGKISYLRQEQQLDEELIYNYLSIASPYLELIEEFTLTELINFHFNFKSYHPDLNTKAVIELLGFEKSKHKPIKYFSSGMKQRTKLALAFCADTPFLLLDEPTANLDNQGIDWYKSFVKHFSSNRLVIICSNQEHEYDFCEQTLNIQDYKT